MRNYVIIGNGVAGSTAAENIRKLDTEGLITLITEEDLPFYWRVRLPEYIAGDLTEGDLLAKKEEWYKEQKVELKRATRITGGDAKAKVVVAEDGQKFFYDRLLIATGSNSFIPPIKGSEKQGVFALRSIKDARQISAWAKKSDNAVLIGGGLLGLEAGNALRKLQKDLVVVEFFPWLLPRQLDGEGGKRLRTMMEAMGFSFRLGAKTQEIMGNGQVSEVVLEGGERLPTQMVIISAGVRPNLVIAKILGVEVDKGVKVDEHLRTSQTDIYAAGDVTEFRGISYGIWPAAMEQGKAAGINMAGGDSVYNGTTMANTLKVAGIDVASAGDIDVDQKFESKAVAEDKVYKKIVIDNNRIIGCIMLGDTKTFNQITKLLTEKRDVSRIKDQILSKNFDFKAL